MIKTYVPKQDVEIRAIQWTGSNLDEVMKFTKGMAKYENGSLYIETREGRIRANFRDFIVEGTMGEFYPVKPDVMEKKYIEKGC